MRPSAIGKPSGNAMRSVKAKISTETMRPPRRSVTMPKYVISVNSGAVGDSPYAPVT